MEEANTLAGVGVNLVAQRGVRESSEYGCLHREQSLAGCVLPASTQLLKLGVIVSKLAKSCPIEGWDSRWSGRKRHLEFRSSGC